MIKAIGWQTLSALYVGVASTLLVFLVGRWLGPEGFGEYSVVLSIISILAIALDGGFRTLIQRETARRTPGLGLEHEHLLPTAVGYSLVTTLALVLVTLGLPVAYRMALASGVATMGAVALVQFWSAGLRGRGAFVEDAGWQAWQRTSTAGAMALGLWTLPVAWVAFAGWCIGAWLALLSSGARALFKVVSWPRLNLAGWWRACAPFVTIDLATAIYFRIDVAMLDWLTGDLATAGFYSAAYRLLEVVVFLFNPLAIVLFRHLRLAGHDPGEFRALVSLTLILSLVLAAVIWAGAWWLGDWMIELAYGPTFAPAATLLPWLMTAVLFILPNAILSQAAIAINKEWSYARVVILAALANVLLNMAWIPLYGAQGAAKATILTEAVLFVGLMWNLRVWLRQE